MQHPGEDTAASGQQQTETPRPQWTAVPATAYTAKPKAAQASLFALGDDPYGTAALFGEGEAAF